MPRVLSTKTILDRLRSPYKKYLNKYEKKLRPTLFELLAVQGFASLLYLPFFDADTDDQLQQYRATWLGKRRPGEKAPGGGPDGIVRAHEFFILVKATLDTSSDQWARKFASALRHAKDVTLNIGANVADVYTVLLATKLHEDTFQAVKISNETNSNKIILLELNHIDPSALIPIVLAVETADMAFTIRHVEVRRLLLNLIKCLKESGSLDDYRRKNVSCASSWQEEVLKLEKATTIAVRSYEVMIRSGRNFVAMSEILADLNRQAMLKKYFQKIRELIHAQTVLQSLEQESLVAEKSEICTTGETVFVPIPFSDFDGRSLRRLKAIKQIHAARGGMTS